MSNVSKKYKEAESRVLLAASRLLPRLKKNHPLNLFFDHTKPGDEHWNLFYKRFGKRLPVAKRTSIPAQIHCLNQYCAAMEAMIEELKSKKI